MIEFSRVIKRYQGLRPLRVADLVVERGDRLALGGFDAAAAEVFINLVTGAAVPDQGEVRIGGRSTRAIATDTEWLASLDRFGIVTERAVFLESMSLAANLALPFTLAIDSLTDETRARVEGVASEVGLLAGRLEAPASVLTPEERIRAHLARALATGPDVLLLEHPTARLERRAAEAIGSTLKNVAEGRGVGWIALTEDAGFARASGARRLQLDPSTGRLAAHAFWRRLLS